MYTRNTGFSKYGICPLIWNLGMRHEKIPETHALATVLTENAWLFNKI